MTINYVLRYIKKSLFNYGVNEIKTVIRMIAYKVDVIPIYIPDTPVAFSILIDINQSTKFHENRSEALFSYCQKTENHPFL